MCVASYDLDKTESGLETLDKSPFNSFIPAV